MILQKWWCMAKNVVRRVNINLALRLREARRETGLSTRAVAAKLPRRFSVSHATIASYENGTTVPPVDLLGALADFYIARLIGSWRIAIRSADSAIEICRRGFRSANKGSSKRSPASGLKPT